MISWRNFDRWARDNGYTFVIQGNGDEVICGVGGGNPIATGRHNNKKEGVPDRPLQEIAFRLGITKRQLEDQIG